MTNIYCQVYVSFNLCHEYRILKLFSLHMILVSITSIVSTWYAVDIYKSYTEDLLFFSVSSKMTNLHEAQSCWDQSTTPYHSQVNHLDSKLMHSFSFEDNGKGMTVYNHALLSYV